MQNTSIKFTSISKSLFLGILFVAVLSIFFLLSNYKWLAIIPPFVYIYFLRKNIMYVRFENNYLLLKYFFSKTPVQIMYSRIKKIIFDYDFKWGYHSEHIMYIYFDENKKIQKLDLQQERKEFTLIRQLLKNESLKHKIIIKGSEKLKKQIKDND